MSNTPRFIFLAFLLLPFFSDAQGSVEYDSLMSVYHSQTEDTIKLKLLDKLHNSVLFKDIKLAKQHAVEQLAIANQIDDNYYRAEAFYNIGNCHKNLGQIDSASYYFVQAKNLYLAEEYRKGLVETNRVIAILELSKGNDKLALEIVDSNLVHRIAMKDSAGLAADYNLKGGIYEHQGNIESAMVNVLKALGLYEQLGNQIGKADALLVLSALENAHDNFEKMLEYDLEALDIYQEAGDLLYTALTHSGIGGTYNNMKAYEKAKPHLLSAIEIAEKLNSSDILGDAKTKLGKAFNYTNNYVAAINTLKEALVHNRANNRALNQVRNLTLLADAYKSQGQYRKAIGYLNEGIGLADKIGAVETLYQAYASRSGAHKRLGNFKEALKDHTQYKILQDSIYNATKLDEIQRMRTKFDTERKEQALIIEKNKVSLLEKEAKVNTLQKLLLGLGLGLALLLGLMGYFALQQKIKRNQLEKEKLDAELDFKKKELTTHALQLAKKNEFLEGLKGKAEVLKSSEDAQRGYQKLISSINFDLQDDNNWENFSKYFEEVHQGFNKAAVQKFPELTSNDLRLMALLKMNLSSKEMANILNISIPGIKKARQRLRKKMGLNSKDSLGNAVLEII